MCPTLLCASGIYDRENYVQSLPGWHFTQVIKTTHTRTQAHIHIHTDIYTHTYTYTDT